jgi:hypothetical protein
MGLSGRIKKTVTHCNLPALAPPPVAKIKCETTIKQQERD